MCIVCALCMLTAAATTSSFKQWTVAMLFMLGGIIFHLLARNTELEEALDASRRLDEEHEAHIAREYPDPDVYNDWWERAN